MIVDITPENFRNALIEASLNQPVAVFFYADELPDCRPMGQLLEQLIGPANPHLTLARVDVANPQLQGLAVQMGLQALPALVIFQGGRPVDALQGPQPEEAIRHLLQAFLPSQADLWLDEARSQLAQQQYHAALKLLVLANQEAPERSDIKLALAEATLGSKQLEQCRSWLGQIPMVDQDSDYQRLVSALELAEQAAESPEIQALEQRLTLEPDNRTLKEELAVQYSQAGRQIEALELLFPLLKQDLNGGDTKKIFLDILASMNGAPEASAYRRKLYSLLY
ncbi:tetratricopeptide repeat protein [Pseudaeromonas sp. ZJS20]|uniref:tetratricopeptide repeat protein n=1 Tax=Pseudaeromonas aegiceratis TaxID=3153928 RepID=UPI00390C8620